MLLTVFILALISGSHAFEATCTRSRGILATAVIKNTDTLDTASAINCTAEEPCFLPFASVTTTDPTKVSVNLELHFLEPMYRKTGNGTLVPVTTSDTAFLQQLAYVLQKSVQTGEILTTVTFNTPYIPPTTPYYLSAGLASQTGFDSCNTCTNYPDVVDYVLKVVVRGENLYRADGSSVCFVSPLLSITPPQTLVIDAISAVPRVYVGGALRPDYCVVCGADAAGGCQCRVVQGRHPDRAGLSHRLHYHPGLLLRRH
jgi:hypothetical protein